MAKLRLRYKGGKGSGNFGHAGRPGKVGGSAPGLGTRYNYTDDSERYLIILDDASAQEAWEVAGWSVKQAAGRPAGTLQTRPETTPGGKKVLMQYAGHRTHVFIQEGDAFQHKGWFRSTRLVPTLSSYLKLVDADILGVDKQ